MIDPIKHIKIKWYKWKIKRITKRIYITNINRNNTLSEKYRIIDCLKYNNYFGPEKTKYESEKSIELSKICMKITVINEKLSIYHDRISLIESKIKNLKKSP